MGTGFLAPQGCGGQTQLTSFGPSLAEPEADSESFIDVISWFQTSGGWGLGGDSSSVLVACA